MVTPPSWWQRLPKPAAVVIAAADPASVYQVSAVRRELRRLEFLLPRVGSAAQPHVAEAVLRLQLAADELLAELEQRE